MAGDFPSCRIPGASYGFLKECQGSFPRPAVAGHGLSREGPGARTGSVCWEPSTIHPPKPAHSWKACWDLAVLSLLSSWASPFLKSAAREISQQNWKCRGHMGRAGTRVEWAVAVNSPFCLPPAAVLAHPKGFAAACASALYLPNSSYSFPCTHPKTAWLPEAGQYPLLCSAESR